MSYTHSDGGRSAAGYRGDTGDCAVRAIAIATGLPYQDVYDRVNAAAALEKNSSRKRGRSNARTGVHRVTARRVLADLGWEWTPTMHIGQGCTVHLTADELPGGRLVAAQQALLRRDRRRDP